MDLACYSSHMSLDKLVAVRAQSSSLFGARYRLEVCSVLQSGETVTAMEIQARLTNPPSRSCLAAEIDKLVSAGFLERLPRKPESRSVPIKVKESPLWEAAAKMAGPHTRVRQVSR